MNEWATISLKCLAWDFAPLIKNLHVFTNENLLVDNIDLFSFQWIYGHEHTTMLLYFLFT